MRVSLLLASAVASASCAACASLASSESTVLQLERSRFDAMTRQDVRALEPMLADDLVYCHSHGLCETKTEFLGSIGSGSIRYRSVEVLELRPRALDDAVVLNGTIAIEGVLGGETRTMRLSFLDVYARRNGRWQLIGWQSTLVR
jgi:hypothetical protein